MNSSEQQSVVNEPPAPKEEPKRRQRGRSRCGRRAPTKRDCRIYERHILNREPQQAIAADYAICQQRVGQIAARVEAWIAGHPEHRLAQLMRLRCSRRWETLWSEAMASFARSREDRKTRKQRSRGGTLAEGGRTPQETVCEQTVREQNGDPRFLQVAWRAADREQQLWTPGEPASDVERSSAIAQIAGAAVERSRLPCDERFAYLPAALGDLEQLACGLQNTTEGVSDRVTEGGPDRLMEGVRYRPSADVAETTAGQAPVSTLFEQRCAEAFRCLGFEVRELGQGLGRVADCLAIATAERFAVIIDAKVRRRGYTLGTDDRQFCEYATRHSRELALTGIERIYFAVIGQGFRQEDLDKLAGFMTGAPIRSVVFIEALALMRLVHESIRDRRQFRLADVDRLLFGNKIIE